MYKKRRKHTPNTQINLSLFEFLLHTGQVNTTTTRSDDVNGVGEDDNKS